MQNTWKLIDTIVCFFSSNKDHINQCQTSAFSEGDMSHKNVFSFQEEGAQLQASFHTVQDKRGGNVNNSASWVVSGLALKLQKFQPR